MKPFQFISYVLACQWYVLRLCVYVVHSFVVFLSKPGARIIVLVGIAVGIYSFRRALDTVIGKDVDQLWQTVVRPVVGRDLATLTEPLNIEIATVAILFVLFLALMMLASILQPVVGALWAPQAPLPPLPPLVVPDTSVRAVKVSRLIKRRRQPKVRNGLPGLSQSLPASLQDVLKEKPEKRPAPPPISVPGSGAGGNAPKRPKPASAPPPGSPPPVATQKPASPGIKRPPMPPKQ